MQGAESEVQQSVRRLIGLFGQVLVELGNLMGAHAQAALTAGAPGPGDDPAASVPESPPRLDPAASSEDGNAAGVSAGSAPPPPSSDLPLEDVRERIERAVDSGLAMLVREEHAAQGAARRESGESRILRPAWMRASPPPFPGEDSGRAAEPERPGEASGVWTRSPEAFQAADLFLVCSGQQGRNLAIPWNWVVDTHLSSRGTPEAFTLSVDGAEQQVTVSMVLGIWTKAELEQWQDDVRWLSSLEALQPAVGTDRAAQLTPPEKIPVSSTPAGAADPAILESGGSAAPFPPMPSAPAGEALAGEVEPALSPRSPAAKVVWVVSPSALARRFLLRHLEPSGIEIREARDLDDPLLPADLGSVGALFLDECLQEQWRDHPSGRPGGPPLVLLTIDGALHVPPAGERSASGAVLPRPFERSEVESVIGWLRSLWDPDRAGGDEDHGDEEDDTWLFADPFGSSGP